MNGQAHTGLFFRLSECTEQCTEVCTENVGGIVRRFVRRINKCTKYAYKVLTLYEMRI